MVATDLLSQAEHGPDSPAVLVTTSRDLGRRTIDYCSRLLEGLVTAPMASVSWGQLGEVVLVDSLDEAYLVADKYASEHVQVLTASPRKALEKMTNYGALFLGPMTFMSYGDKYIGTNHMLQTRGGASRYTGGLWVGKFLRTVPYQELRSGKASGCLGRLCGRAARYESFEGYTRSADLKAHKYLGDKFD